MDGPLLQSRTATRILQLALVAECAGALGIAIRAGTIFGQIAAGIMLIFAAAVCLGANAKTAYVVAAGFALAALSQTFSDEHLAWISIPAHATRIGVALALARPKAAIPILRYATAMTFAAHGVEALSLHPKFASFILHSAGLAGLDLSATTTHVLLRIIGGIDVLVATSLLVRGPRPYTATHMSVWGILTACMRTAYYGPLGIFDTLIRAANGGAPFALWLSWRARASAPSRNSQNGQA